MASSSSAYFNLFSEPQGFNLHRFQLLVSKSLSTFRHSISLMTVPGAPFYKNGRIGLMGFEQEEVSFKYQHTNVHLNTREQILVF